MIPRTTQIVQNYILMEVYTKRRNNMIDLVELSACDNLKTAFSVTFGPRFFIACLVKLLLCSVSSSLFTSVIYRSVPSKPFRGSWRQHGVYKKALVQTFQSILSAECPIFFAVMHNILMLP